jgi:hypothetical protein
VRTRTVLVLAAMTVLLSLLAASAAIAAPEYNQGYREKVDLAGAVWIDLTETTFTDVTLRVHEGTEQVLPGTPRTWEEAGLTLFYLRLEHDPEAQTVTETNYEVFDSIRHFTFDRSLRSGATAHGSVPNAYGWRCTYSYTGGGDGGGGPHGSDPAWPPPHWPPDDQEPDCAELDRMSIELELTWTGHGPVHRDVWRMREAQPALFLFHARTVMAARAADVTGRILGDGMPLIDGPATFGILLRGAYLQWLLVNG